MTTLNRRTLSTFAAAIAATLIVSASVFVQAPPARALTASGIVNTYQAVSAVAGSTVQVTGGLTGEGTPFAIGDKVMLIQMTGAPPTPVASTTSGFGNYDVATITAISGADITLSISITKTYEPSTEAVQLVRFFSDPTGPTTLTGDVTAKPWDGITGGVIAMDGATLDLTGGNIDAGGTGFTNANPPYAGPPSTPTAGQGTTTGRGFADESGNALGGGGLGGGGGTNNTGNSTGGSLGTGGMGNGPSGYVYAPGTNGGPACQDGAFYGALGAAGGGGGITGGGGGGGGFDGVNFGMPGGSGGAGGGVAGGGAGGSGLTFGCSNFEMSPALARAGSGGGTGAPGNGGDGILGGDSGQAPINCDPETSPVPCSLNEGSAGAGGGSYGGGGGAASNYTGGDDSSGGGGGGSWTGGGQGGAPGESSGFAGGNGNAAVGTQIPDTDQYLNATYPRLMMGGAGGLGSSQADLADDPNTAADETNRPVVGGAGGGIVYTDFWTITGDGEIRSDGANGSSPADFGGGAHSGAGAGAGGQMHILARSITAANLVLAVNGGKGGTPTANNYHGGVSGGGGGAGGIWLELAGAVESCPAGPVDNVTFQIAGGSAGDSIINPKDGGSDTARAGDGATGLACVTPLAAPVITVDKTLKSSTPAADGSYTVIYDIVVTNSGDADGVYDLSDTLRPGAGAEFVSGTWDGPGALSGAMSAPPVATVFVQGRTLLVDDPATLVAENVETYTVTATYTIDNTAIVNDGSSNSMDCTVTSAYEPNGQTGFNNVASLTAYGVTTEDAACAPFGHITMEKTSRGPAVQDPVTGEYTVVYDIVVTNDSGVDPDGAPAAYSLTDMLHPGAGAVFESGTWTGPGGLGGVVSAPGTATTLVTDRLLTNATTGAANVETFTVTVVYSIDPAAVVVDSTENSSDCVQNGSETTSLNTGFNNVATVSTGGEDVTDDACEPFDVPEPAFDFVKSLVSSTPNGDGTYDVVYEITVTNTSGVTGAPGEYDLSDTLKPGAGAVFVSGSWMGPVSTPPLSTTVPGANTAFPLADGVTLSNVVGSNVHTYTVTVTYEIDNTLITPSPVNPADPNNSMDCYPPAEFSDELTGFNNVATLTTDDGSVDDSACAPFGHITMEKTSRGPAVQDLTTGEYTVVYDIVVTNDSGATGATAAYDLEDMLHPGAGAVFESGTWTGPNGLSGAVSAPGTATTLVTDRLLTNSTTGAANVETFTVTVVYSIDPAAVVVDSTENSSDCVQTGSETTSLNTGFNNVATVSTGGEDVTDDACEPFDVPEPAFDFVKSLVSSTPNGDGTYDVVYEITVTNTSGVTGAPGEYDLSDTLKPGAGAVFVEGAWTGPDGLGDDMVAPPAETVLVTGRTLTNDTTGGANAETYTVTVTYEIDNTLITPSPVDPAAVDNSMDCYPPVEFSDELTGFNNVATLTTDDGSVDDSACAPFGHIKMEKNLVSSIANPDGTYDVVYDIVVTNDSGATGAEAAYDLTDTLSPGAGAVFVDGSWVGPDAVVHPLAATDVNSPVTLATDQLLTNVVPDNVETYTVSVTYEIDAAAVTDAPDDSSDCAETTNTPDALTGFNNVATLTTGGQDVDDNACAPFGKVTVEKKVVSSTANADGSYDVVYDIVVTNTSGPAGASVAYDLEDTLSPGAGAVFGSGTWTGPLTPAPGEPMEAPGTATVLATDRLLTNDVTGGANVDTYTVTVKYTIDETEVTDAPDDSSDCVETTTTPDALTGFNNVATLTHGGEDTVVNACAPFGKVTMVKNLVSSTANADGTYDVVYEVVVTNDSGPDPVGAEAAYDLSDTLRPGAGAVFVSGSWTGPDAVAHPLASTDVNTAVTFATDQLLTNDTTAAANVHTYTVAVTYSVDNSAIVDDGTDDSTDCVETTSTPDALTGFNNVASLVTGGETTTDNACAPFGHIVFEKNLVSSTVNADGSYDVVYEVVVTNDSGPNPVGAEAAYDLSDTLRPGAGAVFVSGSWTGPDAVAHPLASTDVNTAVTFATDQLLTNDTTAAANVHTYTVAVTYSVDNSAIVDDGTDDSTDCVETTSTPDALTGFNNVASLVTGGETTTDNACAPFGHIVFEKNLVSSTVNADGSYDVVYEIVVTNDGEAEAAYDLSDTLRPGAGAVFVEGAWTGPGALSGTFAGVNTPTVLATDRVLTNDTTDDANVETFTVTVTYTVDRSLVTVVPDPVSSDCTATGSEAPDGNTGFNNVATLTTGGETTTDDACAPFGVISFEKNLVSSTVNADGGYDVIYSIVVTNTSGADGAPAVYDLSDTLRPGAGAVFVSGSWGGATSGTFTGANVSTVFAIDRLLSNTAPVNVDTYTVTVTYDMDGAAVVKTADTDSTDCVVSESETDGNTGFHNVATLTTGGTTTTDDACAPFEVPKITIVKGDDNGNAADTEADAALLPDGTANLVYTITNTGTEALKDVEVTDTVVSNGTVTGLSCDFSALGGPASGTTWDGPFNVGDSFDCTASLTGVLPGDPIHENIGTVTGTGVISGKDVDDDNPYHATTEEPEVEIVKGDSNGRAADLPEQAVVLPTGTADLVYTITNTGTEALTNVTVTDTVVSNGTVTGLTCDFSALGGPATGTTWAGPFAVGATFDCTASLTGVKPGAVHKDVATVTGTGVVSGTDVDDDNPYHATTPQRDTPDVEIPGVEIVKSDTNGNAADTAEDAADLPDGRASLVYTITNNGTEALTDIEVTDTVVSNGKVTGLTCDFSALGGPASGTTWDGPFEIGASFDCTASLTDVMPGTLDHENIGTVTATGAFSGDKVSDDNPYFGNPPKAVAPPATPPLAVTGANVAPLVGGAGIILAAGLVLFILGRRRRANR